MDINNYKKLCCKYNKMLEKYNLVQLTSGNVSIRVNDTILIKPSGILFSDLNYKDISVIDLKTKKLIEGKKPSTDSHSHILVYNEDINIGSVIHTHSNYATAFAACNKNIPIGLTAMADEFGGEIKCSNYAEIGGEEIGKEIIRLSKKTGAVLLKNHGVFTVGKNVNESFRKAVMLENITKTTFLALQLGGLNILNEEEIENNNFRYKNNYGQ